MKTQTLCPECQERPLGFSSLNMPLPTCGSADCRHQRKRRMEKERLARLRGDDGSNETCPECQVRPCARSALNQRRPTCGVKVCVAARQLRQGNEARRKKAGLGGPEGECRVCHKEIPFRPGKGMRPVTCWQPGTTCLAEWTVMESARFKQIERDSRPTKLCVICQEPVARRKTVLCANPKCKQAYDVGNTKLWRHGHRISKRDCKVCGDPVPMRKISLCGKPECDVANQRNHSLQRRVDKLGNGGSHTVAEWRAIVARFDGHCAYCDSTSKVSLEHVLPLARGGSNYASNLLPVCGSCNNRKRHRTLWEWSKSLLKRGLGGSRRTSWPASDRRFQHVIIERPTRPLLYSRTIASAGPDAVALAA